MTNVMVVSKDVNRCSQIADALVEMPLSLFFVDSVSKAEAYAEHLKPAVLLLDSLLPDPSLRGLAAALSGKHPVFVVGALEAGSGAAAPVAPGAAWLSLDEVREAVRQNLRRGVTASVFSVVEYIQLACMSRRTVKIVCFSPRATGYITIVEGEVWDAGVESAENTSQLHDEAAFRYWVTRETVAVEVTATDATSVVRHVFAQWEHLLLESMQLKDEGRLDSLRLPLPPTEQELVQTAEFEPVSPGEPRKTNRPTAPPSSSQTYPERARALVNQAIRAIMIGDYVEAERAFEGALVLAPDDQLVEQRLHKVREFLKNAGQS